MSHNITIEGGTSVRLPTAGKYCDRDIIVTASGGGDDMFVPFVERTVTELQNQNLTKISQYICYNYTTLKSADFPNVTTIETYAFNNCTGLTSIIAPSLKTISTYSFYNCTALSEVNFSEVNTIGGYAFRQCRKISKALFPKLTSIGQYALSRCNVLTTVDLGFAPNLQSNLFAENSNLKTIILRKSDGVVTLSATNAFSSTPFASGGRGGTVYCPSALIETYQTATNWATLYTAGTCEFVPIEGSEYE